MTLRFAASAGGVKAQATDRELAVLRAVPGFLSTVAEDDSDPAYERLNPPVYAEDEAADHEFRRLTAGDVDQARSRDRDALEEVLDRLEAGPTEMSLAEGEACVRAIGSARIALAARSGLFDLEELPAEPGSPQEMLVAFLGIVQEELVDALSDALPVAR